MKDIPGHMMKFMRKVLKNSTQDINDESYKENYKKEITSKQNHQKVKKRKNIIKKTRRDHIPQDLTPDEKNKLMKERTPRMRERSHKTEIHISKK
jgi:hypothetical protein